MPGNRSWLVRIAAALLLVIAAACAHDRALDRREVSAMQNASPWISPWAPAVDPIVAYKN